MALIRRFSLLTMGLLIVLLVAACGSASPGGGPYGATGSSGASQTPASTSSSSGSCGRYCTKVTPTTTSSASIQTAKMTINGKSETVLTNSQGFTLYYRTSDTAASVCSGACTSAWPPFLSSTVPSSSTALPGKLSIVKDANGSQVAYNGHPLYTFSGDSAPGQTNGEGAGGVWFVVPIDLAPQSGSYSSGYGQ